MGLFSDIISSVGNAASSIFGGGDNSDQKKRQQQQNIPTPSISPSPVRLPAVFQAAQQQNNPLRPVNFGPTPVPQAAPVAAAAPSLVGQLLPNSSGPTNQYGGSNALTPMIRVSPTAINNTPANIGPNAPVNPNNTTADKVVNTVVNATARAGIGAAQGVSGLVDLLPGNGTNRVSKSLASDAQSVDQAQNGNGASGGLPGRVGSDIYHGTQIAENVAPLAAGAVENAGKIAGLVKSGVAGIKAIPSALEDATKVTDDVEGVTGDKTPVESGTKAPNTATNAPAGEKNAPPEVAPNAPETGIKSPPVSAPEPVAPTETPATPAVQGSQVNPTLEKTGNDLQDLQNTTGLVRNLLENGRDYSDETPPVRGANSPSGALLEQAGRNQASKNGLQRVLDLANSHLHSNNVVSSALNSRMAAALSDGEARNVRNAIETGSTKGLSDKEATVVKSIKENVEAPSNTTRTNLSKDYQQANNHFPQVRNTSVKDAVKGAAKAKGLNGKINTFDDLLNQNSRFSEGSSMGNFTRGGKTITGDAGDLGLVAKKNGTFVDKAGKVYNYSRATSQDLENAGAKIQAPKDALTAYVRDTLNLKTRADAADYLVKNSDGLGLHDTQTPGAAEPVSIKGSDGEEHSFFTDKKTAQSIKDSGILGNLSKETNLPTKTWNALSSIIAQGAVVNPFAHGLNLATNAAVGSGERANGITGVSALARAFKPIDEAAELRMSDAGVHLPTYGKDTVNAISKATGGLSKLNEATVAAIDKQARSGMFESLTKGGMSDKEAAATVNKWMGGRSVYKGDQANLGIFWKYFVRQNANAGRILTQAAQGHPGALINAAIAGGATFAADKGLKDVTGNQGAYIHAPGVVGVINDAGTGAKDLATGQYRNAVNPLVTHINPLVTQAAEQALGVNNYGDKFANGQARVANLEGITPESNAFNNNGHSLPEKALNTFGVYTPHIKGNAATDNPALSALNVKNAQNGSSVAFPKDFTGEQEANVANKLGSNYTSKSAAILGTQTQSQQQKQLAATTTLKKYGITDATDVENFAKLSTKDQGSYVDAVDALNKAGTAVSTTSVQDQLVKNGNVALAAGMNKAIPNSLPQEAKNTLETYSTLGTAGQKGVWLQNNDNAANYYPSVIAQKQAEGALTTDDTDMNTAWSGSGGTLYVNAAVAETNKQNNVPQSLVELYKNTTKAEFDGTSTTGVNVSAAQQAQLAQYAQQLAANGVTDKFGIANGTSGSSGGSSSSTSAETLDRDAGLPYGTISESFVKPTSDPGVKAVSPLAFKAPTLLKYGPDAKSNPYVRAISVKAVK